MQDFVVFWGHQVLELQSHQLLNSERVGSQSQCLHHPRVIQSPPTEHGGSHENGLSGIHHDSLGDVMNPKTLCQAHISIRIWRRGFKNRKPNPKLPILSAHITEMSLEYSGFGFSLRQDQMSLNPVSLLPLLSITYLWEV